MLYFIAGFALGLAVSAPIITLFWMGANKVAEAKYRSQLMSSRLEIMSSKKKVEDAIGKLRMLEPEMTDEQERIAREQLSRNGNVFQARERT